MGTDPDHIRRAVAKCKLPLENLPLLGNWPWATAPQSLLDPLTYKSFLCHLIRLFCHLPDHNIGTHSMRRGGATEKIDLGIEARLMQWIGRWKSSEAFEGYIDSRANKEAVAVAMTRARP